MAETSWYSAAFASFASTSKFEGNITNYFKKVVKETLNLADAESFLSIGCARGGTDSGILSTFPKCKTYWGVEPSGDSLKALEEQFEKDHPHIQRHLVCSAVEDCQGPDDLMDVVFASHVMYYFDNTQEILKRFLGWVKPGGFLIFVMLNEDSITKVAKHFNVSNITNESYRQGSLLRDLEAIDAKVVSAGLFDNRRNLKNVTQDLVNFYLQKQASPKEVEEVRNFLGSLYPDGEEINHQHITIVQRE